jgi:hypothetical protein
LTFVCCIIAPSATARALSTRRDHGERDLLTSARDADRARIAAYVATLGRGSAASGIATMHGKALIPAFARKYGLPCSACHTVWPELNNFGQVFRDNGYQLKNDRDSPIDVSPAYWPAAVRITPQWHMERTTHQVVDAIPGDPTSPPTERTLTTQGFDLSGMDLLMLGTLYKDISFGVIPSSDNHGQFHLEAAYVRFSNLMKSSWANLKVGKFELDNLVSEKRELLLSANGGLYQSYHFVPVGDVTSFGVGDNQLGAEFSGHSANSYTRYSVGAFSGSDGEVGLPAGRGYDGAVSFSQAFEAGALGLQRLGGYAYLGRRPTAFETVQGVPIPGTGTGDKSFYRIGAAGDFFLGPLELLPLYMHASDDAALAAAGPPGQLPPPGAENAVWNAGFIEAHYYINQQFVLLHRTEVIRMSKQALPDMPTDLGNIDAMTFGLRWYPIMLSRTGLAVHAEYSTTNNHGTMPLSGTGSGLPPLDPATRVRSSSVFLALDFAF